MRVLVLGLNYAPEPTGVGPYTTAMAQALSADKHDVRVVTAFPHYPHWRSQRARGEWRRLESLAGVRVRRTWHFVPRRPRGVARAISEASFGVMGSLQRWGRADAIILISPALVASSIALVRARLFHPRAPVGLVMHDFYGAGLEELSTSSGRSFAPQLLRRLESFVARKADGVVVIHDRFRKYAVSELRVPEKRVTTIRNWTHIAPPPAERSLARRRYGWGVDETIVLHTGAMGQKQSLQVVVEAARRAYADRLQIRFVLVGVGGQRARLEATSEGLPSVQFLDPVPDAEYGQLLKAADVLLVSECAAVTGMALPSKLTSYFAAGIPVLAATNPMSATAEEVRHSRAGVVIPPDDADALLGAVVSLGKDRVRAGEFGANGRRYALTTLDEGRALVAYKQWVESLTRSRVASGRWSK